MPVKKSKPKTPEELQQLLDLFLEQEKDDTQCNCFVCGVRKSARLAAIESLRYALGIEEKSFTELVEELKEWSAKRNKDHASHSE
jgi:hypothetical protein